MASHNRFPFPSQSRPSDRPAQRAMTGPHSTRHYIVLSDEDEDKDEVPDRSRHPGGRNQLPVEWRQAEKEGRLVIQLESDSDEENTVHRPQQGQQVAPTGAPPRVPRRFRPTNAPSSPPGRVPFRFPPTITPAGPPLRDPFSLPRPTASSLSLYHEEATTLTNPPSRSPFGNRHTAIRGPERPPSNGSTVQSERPTASPSKPPGFGSRYPPPARVEPHPEVSHSTQFRLQPQAQSQTPLPPQSQTQIQAHCQAQSPMQLQTQSPAQSLAQPQARLQPQSQAQPEAPKLQGRVATPPQTHSALPHLPQSSQIQGTQSERPRRWRAQPVSLNRSSARPAPAKSPTRPPTTATTSIFPNVFKQYTPPNAQNSSNQGPGGAGLSSSKATPGLATRRTKRSICNNCLHGKLRCDGIFPACNLCTQHGVSCSYEPNSIPTQPNKDDVLKIAGPVKTPGTTTTEKSADPAHEPASLSSTDTSQDWGEGTGPDEPDAVPAGNTKIALHAPHPPLTDTDTDNQAEIAVADQTPESVDSESHASGGQDLDRRSVSSEISELGEPLEIDLTFEAVTDLMESLHKELRAWHEISTQAALRQATTDARNRPGPRLDRPSQDPFKAVTEERRLAGNIWQKHSRGEKMFVVRAPAVSFSTGAVLLPKYQAIGRVSSNILAPNRKTVKHVPYSAEDENDPDWAKKYDDFENHHTVGFDSLRAQQKCQELIWRWKPWMEETLARLRIRITDVLYLFIFSAFENRACETRSEELGKCQTCGLAGFETRKNRFRKETFDALPRPDDRSLTLAALLARAFHNVAKISLWHIAVGGLDQPQSADEQESTVLKSNLCLICFRHHCPDHGSYEDLTEHTPASQRPAFINNREQDSNIRRYVTLPGRGRQHEDKRHLCGVFCVEPSLNVRQILGRQPDGTVSGDSRPPKKQVRRILADDELCGPSCFWEVNNRRDVKASEVKFLPLLTDSQKSLVQKLMPFYLNNQRGPCLISRVIKDSDCLTVFNHMISAIFDTPHSDELVGTTFDKSTDPRGSGPTSKKGKPLPESKTARSKNLAIRPPFQPCFHAGACHSDPACTCAVNKVHCERFCGCDQSCKRRFRGCSCKAGGAKVCFKDNRCDCWRYNRECDPHLCGECGVIDVLDSVNKYRDEVRTGRCRNNRIQLGLPAATTKAPSQIQGYGLYSRAEISMGDFIGEYTGEIVSISEANRRGTIYHLMNQEYLFSVNRDQEIDGSRHGNKMRFMNNSQREENINVESKSLLCNGLIRIGLFAKRDIRAGEELLLQYGYSPEKVKFFWEPGENPVTARALIPFSNERMAKNTGRNKLAGETSRNAPEKSTQSLRVHRKPKRKRPIRETPEQEGSEAVPDSLEEQEMEVSDDEPIQVPEIDDLADSDYAESDNGISDEEPPDHRPNATTSKRGANRSAGRAHAADSTESPRPLDESDSGQRHRPDGRGTTTQGSTQSDTEESTQSDTQSEAIPTTKPTSYKSGRRANLFRRTDKRRGGRAPRRARY
ncbi:hypothetical protein PV04_00406 [Phialophora macrospora]|uniref:SET domain-containing protein n=1 Tax=Phialophora macrospora TaxID=1851006 RepID=A0A0D2ED24_9EURO|nr:hypothetical protein PV04_00406 [Phialophora macrospora]